jgi:hypothetical protein
MAWERSFEKRILKIREKELRFQRLNYTIEVGLYFIVRCANFEGLSLDVVELHLPSISYHRHPRCVLAFHSGAWASVDAKYSVYFGEEG